MRTSEYALLVDAIEASSLNLHYAVIADPDVEMTPIGSSDPACCAIVRVT